MRSVHTFNLNLESQAWHNMEDIAYHYPKASRLLALPIAISIFTQHIILPPVSCIEEITLTIKSIKAYRLEQNPLLLPEKGSAISKHFACSLTWIVLTPLSPLFGIARAIFFLVSVALIPFVTAKLKAADADFHLLLEEKSYKNLPLYANDKDIHYANEVEFARTIFKRFGQQITETINDVELKNLHFLDENSSKERIINEIALKTLKLGQARHDYTKKQQELENSTEDNKKNYEIQILKLNETWKQFQRQLIEASEAEANTLVFTAV